MGYGAGRILLSYQISRFDRNQFFFEPIDVTYYAFQLIDTPSPGNFDLMHAVLLFNKAIKKPASW